MNILEVNHVSMVYGSGTPFRKEALRDVSLGFEQGKITGLIGHTGSGKSTLVHLLNGLLRPSEGSVLLDGVDIWTRAKKIRDVRFRVGLVMQYPEYQLFDETVREDIGFGPRNMGLSEEEIAARVDEAIEYAGVSRDLLDKSPFDLSGGQKRRVAIAGVLAMKPEVLVMDEPAAGLDPRGRREILGRLRRYRDENNATVILVSHSMEDMALYCDNVIVMNEGKLFLSGSTAEVFSHAKELASVGLDVPMIAHVAEKLQEAGISLTGTLYTVSGVRDAILAYLSGEEVTDDAH